MRRQSRDIPFIQLVADNSSDAITDALMLGAQDALPQGEDERLVLVANRELAGLAERRARRAAELALREAEKRCQLLLDSSVDAITYVHDGMHIYANRSYMALFGYEDAEELEGLPVIDLIASCDQGAFKISSRATRTTSARPNWFAPGSSSTARNSRRASASPPPPTTANPASRW